MHGLVLRSFQCFLRDTYGPGLWLTVARDTAVPSDGFEAMLHYDDRVTEVLISSAAQHLRRPRETILEDLGTYLVSHPNLESLRRLLRFGGVGFVDFLHSLEEIQGRGRLAVPDLDLPMLELSEPDSRTFVLTIRGGYVGTGHVIVGLLRAMADDYGALVMLDHAEDLCGGEAVTIHLLDTSFAEGRSFDLAIAQGVS